MQTITANLIKAYFGQGTIYYSESGDAMITIADMHPTYAANTARRLLTDAPTWSEQAGSRLSPARWMLGTKLFQALTTQAQS